MAMTPRELTRHLLYRHVVRFAAALVVVMLPPILALYLLVPPLRAEYAHITWLVLMVTISALLLVTCVYVFVQSISLDKTVRPLSQLASVGELAARVAHDIRGPIASIQTALSYLHTVSLADPQYVQRLNLLELSTNRLNHTAEDLLRQHGGREEEMSTFDIHHILEELLGEYEHQPNLQEVVFQRQFLDQPLLVHGQRYKLQRLFANLVKNGLEAMEVQGLMTVTTTQEDGDAVITIHDSGCGMTPERAQALQSGLVTTDKRGGHGIGLTSVQETLQQHTGTLQIESELGAGSRFMIRLPRAQEPGAEFTMLAQRGQGVLVIADDERAQQQWQQLGREQDIALFVFKDYEESQRSSSANGRQPNCATAIVDLRGVAAFDQACTLLQRLQAEGIAHGYLCTVEHWKPSVQRRAQILQIGLCPKPLPSIRFAYLSTVVPPPAPRDDGQGYVVLVIDDDEDIHFAWELMIEELHIQQLHAFANYEAALASGLDVAAVDIVFVDKNIPGTQWSVPALLEDLRSRGATKVVLASGEDSDSLRADPQCALADFVISQKVPLSFTEFFG